MSPRLLQSKSYLKLLGIPYLQEDTNLPITPVIIERVIKSTYIFNDTVLASCSQVIKVFPKSDMAVIQVNIQDSQNSIKAKCLINRCFNVSYLSRSLMEDFILFFSLFYFSFLFLFLFLFLEQLGLGFISHAVTSVTN